MIHTVLVLLGVGGLLFLVYPLTLYPSILLVAGRRRTAKEAAMRGATPALVSVVLPARDEADEIEDRLRDVLAQELDVPLEIVVVSDASADGTDERVAAFPDDRVRLLRVEGGRGKTACQQAGIAAVSGEVVVLTDCGARWAPDAVARLLEAFEDPEVACAGGRVRYAPGEDGSPGKDAGVLAASWKGIWRYEDLLRRLESRAGGLTGVSGFLCALRREDAPDLPEDLYDDWPLAAAVVAAGKRCVYVPEAVAWKAASGSLREDFARRFRNAVLTLQTLWRTRSLWLRSSEPLFAFQVLSHKVHRYLTPFLLLLLPGLLAGGLVTAPSPAARAWWAAVGLAGAGLLLASLLGLALGLRGLRTPFWWPGYFLLLQLVLLAGWVRWLTSTAGPASWRPQRVGAPSIPGEGRE